MSSRLSRRAWASRQICLDEAAVLRDGFGDNPEFEVILAEGGNGAVGYALYFDSYEPTYAARGLYLADLYVDQAFRRQGIGRALLAAVAAESRQPAWAGFCVVGAMWRQTRPHKIFTPRWV